MTSLSVSLHLVSFVPRIRATLHSTNKKISWDGVLEPILASIWIRGLSKQEGEGRKEEMKEGLIQELRYTERFTCFPECIHIVTLR